MELRLWFRGLKACDLVPGTQGCGPQFTMVGGWNVVAGNMKEVGNRVVHGSEALKVSCRFEALHDPFPPSDWLMGVFRPIVQAVMRTMLDAGHDLTFRCTVGSKLVGLRSIDFPARARWRRLKASDRQPVSKAPS
ncbi:hypothetical protein D9M69_576990 [compost metagenome]